MNPSEALYQENQELRRRLAELEADLITAQAIALEESEPMECDHPRAALNPDGITRYCRWCADLQAARAEEREANYRELCPWCREGHTKLVTSINGILHDYGTSYRQCLASPLRSAHLFANVIEADA